MDKFFSSDLAIKIISVIVAIVMWMYVMNEQNPQVTYVIRDVPVKLVNIDSSKFALTDDSQKYFVNVKVKGRRSLVADLKPSDIDAEVNLRGRMEGENLLPVSVSVPGNVELLDFSPKEIMVNLDSIVEEQIPVTVEVKGMPGPGYAAMKAEARPQAVVVKGPRSRIDAIKTVDAVKTVIAQVDIAGKNSTVVSTLPLRVLDSQGKEQKNISVRPDMVEVTVPIVPVKTVSITPNIKGSPPEGYIISDVRVEPSQVLVTAPKEVLDNIEAITTELLFIQGSTQSVTKEIKLTLPSSVKVFNEDIKTVLVTVKIEKLSSKPITLNTSNVSINGISSELTAHVENKDIVLTVSGPESIIDRVNAGMIKLYVNASGLYVGEHNLKVQAEILEPYTIQKIEPDTLKITIRRI